jgi:hypothetical protein
VSVIIVKFGLTTGLIFLAVVDTLAISVYFGNLNEINNPCCPECNERSDAEIKDIRVYSQTAVQMPVVTGETIHHGSSRRPWHVLPSQYHNGRSTHYGYETFYKNNYLVPYGHTSPIKNKNIKQPISTNR